MSSRPTIKLAVVISHPIQYFAPLFKRLAGLAEIDLTVLYSSSIGASRYRDPAFGTTFAWDLPLLDGYVHKVMHNLGRAQRNRFFSYTSPAVFGELWRGRYDAVIVFGWGDATSWCALAAARLGRIPYLLYGDTNPLYEAEKPPLKRFVRARVLGRMFKGAAAILATGSLNREFYRSHGVPMDKCFNVPLAVDNGYFEERAAIAQERREEVRKRYSIPLKCVLVLFVGKLETHKRPQDVLTAVAALRARFKWLGAAFAGDGELKGALEAKAARQGLKDIFFLGFRNQSELPEIYAIADMLVLPSASEARGLVVNEAMACGLPVIVSDRTGVWGEGDMVRAGENGFVYPCGDTFALAGMVGRLAGDSKLRERMGQRSREIIQEFGYDSCVLGILEALTHVGYRRVAKAWVCS